MLEFHASQLKFHHGSGTFQISPRSFFLSTHIHILGYPQTNHIYMMTFLYPNNIYTPVSDSEIFLSPTSLSPQMLASKGSEALRSDRWKTRSFPMVFPQNMPLLRLTDGSRIRCIRCVEMTFFA